MRKTSCETFQVTCEADAFSFPHDMKFMLRTIWGRRHAPNWNICVTLVTALRVSDTIISLYTDERHERHRKFLTIIVVM